MGMRHALDRQNQESSGLLECGYADRTPSALVARVVFARAFNRSTHLNRLNVRSHSIEHRSISEFRDQVFRVTFSERMIKDA
jgi:hypothetical protein